MSVCQKSRGGFCTYRHHIGSSGRSNPGVHLQVDCGAHPLSFNDTTDHLLLVLGSGYSNVTTNLGLSPLCKQQEN